MISRRAKSLLKQFASPVLDRLGVFDRALGKMPAEAWTIAMYHRVVEDPRMDPFSLGMCVARAHFDAQLAYFKRNFSPIGLREAVALIQRGEPLPPRALSITFDDGYLDNYTVALPVLRHHGMVATLFVPTGGIHDDEPLWWDRVIHALDGTSRAELRPADVGLPMPDARLSLLPHQRADTAERVLDALWTLPIDRILACVGKIEQLLAPFRAVAPVARRMAPPQVRAMHEAGIEIGAHSVRHSNLSLETPAVVRAEMQRSKRFLEDLCEAPIPGFAYPAGWKNADTEAAVLECGFSYAVSTVSGLNTASSGLTTLRRVGMPDSPLPDFKRAFASVVAKAGSHGQG